MRFHVSLNLSLDISNHFLIIQILFTSGVPFFLCTSLNKSDLFLKFSFLGLSTMDFNYIDNSYVLPTFSFLFHLFSSYYVPDIDQGTNINKTYLTLIVDLAF